MIVLGLSGSLTHDPSAALFVNGELVSAVEEERFLTDAGRTHGHRHSSGPRACSDLRISCGIDSKYNQEKDGLNPRVTIVF